MFSWIRTYICYALLACSLIGQVPAQTPEASWRHSSLLRAPPVDPVTDRIIVKWRDTGVAVTRIEALESRTALLRERSGLPLHAVRSFGAAFDVLRLARDYDADAAASASELHAAIAQLQTNPFIEYAEADERIYALSIPNDPRYTAGSDALGQWTGQWYLGDPNATTLSAVGATTAWDTARGDKIVVAVIDSGIRADHPELLGKTWPGFDFVCYDNGQACDAGGTALSLTANDGSGWDADPADPGDGLAAADLARADRYFNHQCGDGPNHDQPIDSTWHGTRVAGIIAALTNNSIGIAGVAPDAKILPVRALGRCGGFTSDLIAAMLWAGGISDASLNNVVSTNQPAKLATILNLSLGNRSACSAAEQSAIDRLIAAGVLIVAAAGNDGGPVGAPGNCNGVLSVAGVRHVGSKVGYSNVSSTAASISIAAPAGNCINTVTTLPCLYPIDTLTNEGKLAPQTLVANANLVTNPGMGLTSYTYSIFNPGYAGNTLNAANVGTSYAAPIVAGVAALMRSVNSQLTPAELIARLKSSATPFPALAATPTGGVCHVAALTRDSAGLYTDVQDRDCQCTTATCGAGMINAQAAVLAALRPLAVINSSATVGSIGQRISLDGSSSTATNARRIASYQWSVDPGISILNPTAAIAEIVFPATRPITVTLVVTDDTGAQDTTSLLIASAVTGTGSGGGGAFEFLDLLLLALLAVLAVAWTADRTRELKRGSTVAMLCRWPGTRRALPGTGR
jgi:serine protease